MTEFFSLASISALRDIDVQLGRLMARLDPDHVQELPILTALASWATGQGHTCLPLARVAELLRGWGIVETAWLNVDALRARLLPCAAVGGPGEATPLVLDEKNNLFLRRFDRFEESIADALRQRDGVELAVDEHTALPLLDRYFPARDPEKIDWQRAAAALALVKPLAIISGGPGTGKTYTVARILAILLALVPELASAPRLALVAPTGKAALRLQSSIQQAQEAMHDAPEALCDLQAQTLHRLLGVRMDRPGFVHNRDNPLHLDLVVIDEASMIDVPLMAALLAALPTSCRIILLGDRDQLASVEAGNLFGDLCTQGAGGWSAGLCGRLRPLLGTMAALPPPAATPSMASALADSLVLLRESRRFAEDSGIGALAHAVNQGNQAEVARVLAASWADINFVDTAQPGESGTLRERMLEFLVPLFAASTPEAALEALGRRRILCGLREGPMGVTGINRLAEARARGQRGLPPETRFFTGMPVLIGRNDYQLELFNGDTGVLWEDAQGTLMAWFPGENGGLRSINLSRLPAWQPAYAMTVHKSQGSEYDEVLLLLPRDDVPVLTRELLYTGMTRARKRLTLYGPQSLIMHTVARRVIRYSGLPEKLRRSGTAPHSQ